jgi:alkanesulfonate monooxygenase SsuD/methylene tetrahydromethanopterin reductase-like flavin-dependent oxidoreductase (luciferase family)
MEIGIGLLGLADVASSARRLEDAGVDYAFCGEHFFFHVPVANTFVSLAAAAGATERIKLLSSITLLPLYPAPMAAKMASVLDVVSNGRFHFGVGVGGEFPAEFEALGAELKGRGRRVDEALQVIRALFSGERTTFAGEFTTLSDVRLDPPPAQPGGPPIWVAGRTAAAQRRAGRHADVWMPYMYTPSQFRDSMGVVAEAAAEAGRSPDAVGGSLWAWVCVHEDGDLARREITAMVSRNYNQDFSRLGHYLVAGTADEVVERLGEYREAGAGSAQLMLGCRPELEPHVLDLLTSEVMPRLREGSGQAARSPAA